MKETINSPHFYEDDTYDKTFEDLMRQVVGGISKHKDTPKMHLWLPKDATEGQVELVNKMIGGLLV